MTVFRHPALAATSHRPYPMASGPWVMSMTWHDLLFMHWPVDADVLRESVPDSLTLDLFEGQAWLGVVPFRMTGVRPRCMPAIPRGVGRVNPSCFLELNVRTYVTVDDRPGVLFFSLDAESKLAVRMARRFFHLPYFDAEMSCVADDNGWFQYRSRRTHDDAPAATFSAKYRPVAGERRRSGAAGTLEHFLTERYCLYTVDGDGRALRGEIHHLPWPLQLGEAEIECLDMTRQLGLSLEGPPPYCHFARRLHVVAWLNRPVGQVFNLSSPTSSSEESPRLARGCGK